MPSSRYSILLTRRNWGRAGCRRNLFTFIICKLHHAAPLENSILDGPFLWQLLSDPFPKRRCFPCPSVISICHIVIPCVVSAPRDAHPRRSFGRKIERTNGAIERKRGGTSSHPGRLDRLICSKQRKEGKRDWELRKGLLSISQNEKRSFTDSPQSPSLPIRI